MTSDEYRHALDQARQREDALARRLDVCTRTLDESHAQFAVQQGTWAELRSADAHFEQQRLAQAARHLNRVWTAERHRASVAGRLRQRLQDAQVPLSWMVRRPLHFWRGAARLLRQDYRLEVAELAQSRLFDAEFSRAVTRVGPATNMAARFLLHGDAAGEPPHPLFDPAWYRLQEPRIADSERPFLHYLRHGGWELRSPHPLFDPRHYLAQFPQATVHAPTPLSHFVGLAPLVPVSPHPLFDVRHYLAQEPDLGSAGGNVLLHYLATGAAAQLDPHPLFDTRFYADGNPDLRGRNPLDHFVRQGAAEGRSPHPLFDVRFYWEQRPEIRSRGANALLDYLGRALDGDVDPHPLFDTRFYLQQVPAARALGLNPLVHFLRWGWREGLRPNPWFDPLWYLDQNPDVVDVNPLLHFADTGWREGRDPSPDFSLAAHLAAHPDVAASGENPLEHHLREQRGHPDGRAPAPRLSRPTLPPVFRVDARDVTGQDLVATLAATVSQHTEFRLWMDARGAAAAEVDVTLASLVDQAYPRWRLDLWVDSGDTPAGLGDRVRDPRIHVWPAGEGLPVPADAAMDDETAFAGCLSAGDALESHALLFAAHAVQSGRAVDLVYADEDTAGASDLSAAVFKPDWDPLLFESVDYLGPCAWVRVRLLQPGLAGLTAGALSAAARHRLFREAVRGLDRTRAVHLPYILVHTAPAQAYSARAAVAPPADLTMLAAAYAPDAEPAGEPPLVSIIIPTKNGVSLLSICVTSILDGTAYPRFEILIVDNGSDDPACLAYLADLARDARCRVIRSPGPFNFSRLNNLGAAEAQGELLCLVNNDIEVRNPQWLGALVAFARRAPVGAVGAILRYPDGAIQHGGVVIGVREVAAHAFVGTRPGEATYMHLDRYAREVSAVTGACLAVSRQRYLDVGGLDEQELPVNFSDIDFCLALRARGFRNLVLPLTGLVHHESASRGEASASPASRQQLEREALVMKQRWGASLRRDPYYSEHLTTSGELYRVEPGARVRGSKTAARVTGTFTALGREPRLDIYAGLSNAARAAEATRARPAATAVDDMTPGLSVLILNRDAPELIVPLVAQLAEQQAAFTADGLGFEVIIGDTGSTDPAVRALYDDLPAGVRVVRDMRYNFSRCNNALEHVATCSTALFLNNDVILPPQPDVLVRGYRLLSSTPGLGVLGSVLSYPDGSIQHMGCDLLDTPQDWGLPYHVNTRTRVPPASLPALAAYPGVTGAFLMIGRALFQQLGGFDRLYAAECQDIALCLEARRLGFDTACAYLGPIVHIENATRPKGEEHWGDRRRFLRKYGAFIRSLAE